MTGETSHRMKLIFVMRNGAFKPQGSPCLKSGIFRPAQKKNAKKNSIAPSPQETCQKINKILPKFPFTHLFTDAIVLWNFDFPIWLRFGIALPVIYCKPILTSGPSKNWWGIRMSEPRWFIPIPWRVPRSKKPKVLWIFSDPSAEKTTQAILIHACRLIP